MHTTYRDDDTVASYGSDGFANVCLQQHIASDLGIPAGWHSRTSVCPSLRSEEDEEAPGRGRGRAGSGICLPAGSPASGRTTGCRAEPHRKIRK
jgi:hypothetical protein